jgi:hypothetical protein
MEQFAADEARFGVNPMTPIGLHRAELGEEQINSHSQVAVRQDVRSET